MRTKLIALTATLGLAIIMTNNLPMGTASQGLTAPVDELIIDGKKPARFPHQGLSAETIAAMDNGDALRCVSCHNANHPDKKLQKAKQIFHARCKDCHKAGYEGKNGPTKCTGCHIKKK